MYINRLYIACNAHMETPLSLDVPCLQPDSAVHPYGLDGHLLLNSMLALLVIGFALFTLVAVLAMSMLASIFRFLAGVDTRGQCSICLEDDHGIDWEITPCGHGYHSVCIEKWRERSGTCPMCRALL